MPTLPGYQYHAPAGRMPAGAGPPYRAPGGGMEPGGMGPAELGAGPGTQYQAPAEGMQAAPELDPPAEYEAVPYQVKALYSAPPDDQAGWAPR